MMEHSTEILLLTTKLKIPAPRKNYIVRHGLFEQLSKCRDMSIIFLSGGAGTGKTTLLSSFIHEKETSYEKSSINQQKISFSYRR